ncbi:MAG TPA: hypothetical protein ENI37_04145 [Chloroflexi bacterium]|nr:hypothetical protein [Chloroflexota bacterium]
MYTLTYKPFYQRRLPHLQPPGATFFITFRLKDSLPQPVLEELRAERERAEGVLSRIEDPAERPRRAYLEQRRLFGKWDAALHTVRQGPRWLENPCVAQIVADSLHYRDGKVYDLWAFCVMPNHVHLVCRPLGKPDGSYHPLSAILHSLKGYTAYRANRELGRKGAFWQDESYDHVVRDEQELNRVITYVLNNPVEAGLVQTWEEWPWAYVRQR